MNILPDRIRLLSSSEARLEAGILSDKFAIADILADIVTL